MIPLFLKFFHFKNISEQPSCGVNRTLPDTTAILPTRLFFLMTQYKFSY